MKHTITIAFFFILIALLPCYVHAQEPGTLDNSFGASGKTEIKITPSARALAVAVQPDGKIIAAGSSMAGSTVVRYMPDGSLDKSFNTDGIDTGGLNNGTALSAASAIAIQPDGKIIVTGSSSSRFSTARYNTDGSKDLSFNGTGLVTTELCGSNGGASGIVLQPDGKIILAGNCNYMVSLARYNTDGSLDNTFNDSGKIVQNYQELSNTEIYDVLIQGGGKIIICGITDPSGLPNYDYDFLLMRYKEDGRRDSSFGLNGQIFLDFGGTFEYCYSSCLQSDGKILFAGLTDNASSGTDFAIARLNSDGTLDNSFGVGGKVIFDAGGTDVIKSIAVQTDGRILAGGYSNDHFVISRFNADGNIDNTFGVNGISKLVVGSVVDNFEGISIQNDGKILAAGWSEYPPVQPFLTRRFVVARYHGNWASKIDDCTNNNGISLFPNPVSDFLFIQNSVGSPLVKVQVINTHGQIIFQETADSIDTIDVKTIPTGLYFIKLFTQSFSPITRPLLIQK